MKKINFNEPFVTGKELDYIADVFNQNRFYGCGKYTKLCTGLIQQRLGATQVLLTDSCTSALETIAILLRDYSQKQSVVLPSYTFTSTASAFAKVGFDLIFAEVDPTDMMLDPKDVEARIQSDTVAIITVHYGGHCSNLKELDRLCKKHQLMFIEDAAQAFDSYLDNIALGTFGDFGAYSFHETKNIHAGLSGALYVKDESLFTRAIHICERGTNRQEVLKGIIDKYSWVEMGGSYLPTELQAAFLFAQLEQLDHNKEKRREIFEAYMAQLEPLRQQEKLWFPVYPSNYESNYHAFWIQFESENICDEVRIHLLNHGVSAYIGYVPLHSSKVGKSMGYAEKDLAITEAYAKRVLRLPFHNFLSKQDINRVCSLIKESVSDCN